MRKWLVLLAALIFCLSSNAAALPDPMAATAASKWSPMQGSPPVIVAQMQARTALRMDCRFAETKFERASWDYQGALDLSSLQTIRFSALCTNATPVSSFVVYFGSGEGWYTTAFPVEADGKWNDVEIRKEDTRIEGTPAGWSKVDRIRISAWRGMDVDTTLYLAGFVATGEQPPVLVVRGDSLATLAPAELQSANQFAQNHDDLYARSRNRLRGDQRCRVYAGDAALSEAGCTSTLTRNCPNRRSRLLPLTSVAAGS